MKGQCVCGAVTVEIANEPEALTDCNCSMCRRLGALWSYHSPKTVQVEGPTVGFQRGDKVLTTHHCPTCGAVICWTPVDPARDRMGVNTRLFDGFERFRVRHLDGADSWTYRD